MGIAYESPRFLLYFALTIVLISFIGPASLLVTAEPNASAGENLTQIPKPTSIPSNVSSSNLVSIVQGSSSPNNSKFYDPSQAYVKIGGTITWINKDSTVHTVTSFINATRMLSTSYSLMQHLSPQQLLSYSNLTKLFDSKTLLPGQTFQHTFDSTGTYDYYCTIHPYMTGQIVVVGSAATKPNINKISSPNVASNKTNATKSNASNTAISNTTNNFLTYENSTVGIKIQYPHDWIKQVQKRKSTTFDYSVNFSPRQQQSPSDKQLTEILVWTKKLPSGNITLDQYTKEQLNIISGIIVDRSTIMFAGSPGYKVIFMFKPSIGYIGRESIRVWTIKNSTVYNITYNADLQDYLTYLPIAEKMIDSFQVTTGFAGNVTSDNSGNMTSIGETNMTGTVDNTITNTTSQGNLGTSNNPQHPRVQFHGKSIMQLISEYENGMCSNTQSLSASNRDVCDGFNAGLVDAPNDLANNAPFDPNKAFRTQDNEDFAAGYFDGYLRKWYSICSGFECDRADTSPVMNGGQ